MALIEVRGILGFISSPFVGCYFCYYIYIGVSGWGFGLLDRELVGLRFVVMGSRRLYLVCCR